MSGESRVHKAEQSVDAYLDNVAEWVGAKIKSNTAICQFIRKLNSNGLAQPTKVNTDALRNKFGAAPELVRPPSLAVIEAGFRADGSTDRTRDVRDTVARQEAMTKSHD